MTKKEEYLAKRLTLSQLSQKAKDLKADFIEQAETANEAIFWGMKTLNYFLLNHIYNTNGATEFNTFNQWKEKGATVLKGEKAFLIWGQPKQGGKKEDQATNENEKKDPYEYFPICYLFSNLQVSTAEQRATAKESQPQEVKEEQPQEMEEFVI